MEAGNTRMCATKWRCSTAVYTFTTSHAHIYLDTTPNSTVLQAHGPLPSCSTTRLEMIE